MTTIKAFKEFDDADMRKQNARARDKELTDEQRKKAKRFALEMMAYNARAMRGDFDSY